MGVKIREKHRGIMVNKKHMKECDCPFCNSECPECGSNAVHVTFNVQFEYTNDTDGFILISHTGDDIELRCEACSGVFAGADQRLERLSRSMRTLVDTRDRLLRAYEGVVQGYLEPSDKDIAPTVHIVQKSFP